MERRILAEYELKANFVVKLHASEKNSKNCADKELAKIGNNYYYYLYNNFVGIPTFSLKQISKAEFETRIRDLVNSCIKARWKTAFDNNEQIQDFILKSPKNRWEDTKTCFSLIFLKNTIWKKKVNRSDCCFFQNGSELERKIEQTTPENILKEECIRRMCSKTWNAACAL